MKNYDELTDRLLQRRDRYIAAQRKKKQVVARTTVSVGSVALVSLAGFALFKNGAFRETPPIANGESTIVTNTPTKSGDITTATTGAQTAVGTTTTDTTTAGTTTPTTSPSKTEPPTTTAPSKTEPSATITTVPTKPLITASEPDNGFANESGLRKKGKYISRRLRQMMELYEGEDVMYAVIVSLPVTEDDVGEDFWNSNEEWAQLKEEYHYYALAFEEEVLQFDPYWDGNVNTVEVWTDSMRANYERSEALWDQVRSIEEQYKGPYVQSVLNQRFEVMTALCEKEPIDIYCAVNGILNVGLHAYYVELTADDINALAEYGGYVFCLAMLDQEDYVLGLLNE